jgi:hypothetical protein
MKTSELLRSAKKYLSKTELHGLCHTVEEATDNAKAPLDAYVANHRARERITIQIEGYGWATTWLAKQVLGDFSTQREQYLWVAAQDPKAIQAWRHEWLDRLIAEFEAEGD